MIRLDHVTKRYKKYTVPINTFKSLVFHFRDYREHSARVGELCVFQDLSLEIKAGEVFCVIGNNGTGKSTLAKLIAGTVKPTAGTVRTEGVCSLTATAPLQHRRRDAGGR